MWSLTAFTALFYVTLAMQKEVAKKQNRGGKLGQPER